MIIVLQLLALSYGIYHIVEGRAVWIVYNVDRFELIRNNDIVENNIQRTLPLYYEISLPKSTTCSYIIFKNAAESNQNMFD
ncbi:hypothetical protein ACW7EJ_01080 [Acinetobacter soli]